MKSVVAMDKMASWRQSPRPGINACLKSSDDARRTSWHYKRRIFNIAGKEARFHVSGREISGERTRSSR